MQFYPEGLRYIDDTIIRFLYKKICLNMTINRISSLNFEYAMYQFTVFTMDMCVKCQVGLTKYIAVIIKINMFFV